MKKITCKNCGAQVSDELSKCPYCGTMNRKGAYKEFRLKISGFVDSMIGLKEETHKSLSRMIFTSFFRSLIIITVIIGLAYVLSLSAKVNYYNDKEYDQKAYEEIIWADENMDKLDEAYAKGDFDTIEKLYHENYQAVSHWAHYSSYVFKKQYLEIMDYKEINEYRMEDILYFLYYPGYYARYDGMSKEEKEIYENDRLAVLEFMEEKGYTEDELKTIYHSCKDNYGYLSYEKLRKHLKEEKNG